MSNPIIQIPGDLTIWLNQDAAFGTVELDSVITKVSCSLSNAPSGGSLVVRISNASGGGGSGILVSFADGVSVAEGTGTLSVSALDTLYARVTTTNGTPMDLIGSLAMHPASFAGDISGEPLSLAAVKEHLRITDTASDNVLAGFIVAARIAAEDYMNHSLITKTEINFPKIVSAVDMPFWSGVRQGSFSELTKTPRFIRLPRGPIQSITSIKSYDDTDAATTFSTSKYYLDTTDDRVVLRNTASWPTPERKVNGLEIIYVTGYSDILDIPYGIKQGILMHIAAMHEHRGDEIDAVIPAGSLGQYHPYKRDWYI